MKKAFLAVVLLLLSITLVSCVSSPKNSTAIIDGNYHEGLKKAKKITKKSGDTLVNYYELTFEREYYGTKGKSGKVYEYEYGYLAEKENAWHLWSKKDITYITVENTSVELQMTGYYSSETFEQASYGEMIANSTQTDEALGMYIYPVYSNNVGAYFAGGIIKKANGRINYLDRDNFGKVLKSDNEPFVLRQPQKEYYYEDDKGFIIPIEIDDIKTYKKTYTMIVPFESVVLIWG